MNLSDPNKSDLKDLDLDKNLKIDNNSHTIKDVISKHFNNYNELIDSNCLNNHLKNILNLKNSSIDLDKVNTKHKVISPIFYCLDWSRYSNNIDFNYSLNDVIDSELVLKLDEEPVCLIKVQEFGSDISKEKFKSDIEELEKGKV